MNRAHGTFGDDYEVHISRSGYIWRCLRCGYMPEKMYGPDKWFGEVVSHYASEHPTVDLS